MYFTFYITSARSIVLFLTTYCTFHITNRIFTGGFTGQLCSALLSLHTLSENCLKEPNYIARHNSNKGFIEVMPRQEN